MSEGKKFSKESAIYIVGEFLSKSLTFILLPIYTSYLSFDDFAILSIITMIWPIVVIFLGRGFSAYIMRGYFEHSDKKQFFSTVIIFSMTTGLFFALCMHLGGSWVTGLIFKNMDYTPYLQYGVFFGLFRLFFNHVLSLYRAKRMAVTSVILSFIQFFIFSVATLSAIFILKTGLLGILNAQLYAFMLVAVIFLVKIFPEMRLNIKPKIIIAAVAFTIPLLPHALSAWIMNYVSRVFVERNMSSVSLSVYAVGVQLAMILNVVNNGLNQAWIPFVYANGGSSEKENLLATNARKIVIFISLLSGLILLFSKELLMLMGKEEYSTVQSVLPILVVSYFFQMLYLIYVVFIIYYKNTKILPVITISTGIACVILNFFLVPMWGLFGASTCTLFSFLMMYFIVKKISEKYIRIQLFNGQVVTFILIIASITALSAVLIEPTPVIVGIILKGIIILFLVKILEWLKIFYIGEFIGRFIGPTKNS